MNSMSLFEVTAEYNHALNDLYDLEQSGEIDSQTFLDTMQSLEGGLVDKAKRVGAYIRNTKAMAQQIKEAEYDMAKRRKSLENHAKGLEDYLLNNMVESGISEINSPWFDLKIKKTPASIKIAENTKLPEEFLIVRTTEAPDKTALKAALKSGQNINGVSLVAGQRLEIK
jgi:hypothetical protein|tara:strand:- start:1487 stop:1996 length:510 start_codon:yes stop_codon:yes gene_type:complete